MPRSNDELDEIVCQFVMHCWQEGETRAVVANLLSGIGNTEPSLKLHLAGARRLYQARVKLELGGRCCPVTWAMAETRAGLLLHWGWAEQALMVLLMHHGPELPKGRHHFPAAPEESSHEPSRHKDQDKARSF